MGGKGGKGTNSTVSQTTTDLPEWVKPFQTALLQRAEYESALPYETYGGPKVADFSPYEQEGMGRVVDLAMGPGNQEALTEASRIAYNVANDSFGDVSSVHSGYNPLAMNGAGDYLSQQRTSGYNPAAYSSQYTAGQREMGFDPGSLDDPDMLQDYMSPYMQDVVDIEKREAMRDADIRHRDTGLDAARAGSLGGYRDAIMRTETERDLGQRLGDIQSQGQQAAFADAKASFEQDRAARATAEQLGQAQFGQNQQMQQTMESLMQQGWSMSDAAQQAREQFNQGQFGLNMQDAQFGASQGLNQWQAMDAARQAAGQMGLNAQQANQQAQLGMQGNQLAYQQNQLAAADAMAGYGAQSFADQLEQAGLLQGIGSQQRQLVQAGIDSAVADWNRQNAYGWEQINMMNNIIHGGAIAPGTSSQMYGPTPDSSQSLVGQGIAAAGMFGGKGGGS